MLFALQLTGVVYLRPQISAKASSIVESMADIINKEVAFAFASNFSGLCSHMLCFCSCVLAKARKIDSKSKYYLFINMSQ
jgi:hypothetical protein